MRSIHPQTRIGHVHLKVADLERSLGFYCDVLGFEVTARVDHSAAFLSAGVYHHHLGLNAWESLGHSSPPPHSTGLYHLAILYPARVELADALRRLARASVPLKGLPTTASAKRPTCAIPTATAWNFIGISPSKRGLGRQMERLPWRRNRRISQRCYGTRRPKKAE